jgi:MFS family permease
MFCCEVAMDPEEKRFWVGIAVFATLFGVGGYIVFEHALWRWIFMVAGLCGLILGLIERAGKIKLSIALWIVAILATWSLIGYDLYDRHHPRFGYDANNAWDDSKPLARIYNGHFTNETVYVDGKNFISPVFDGVTLIYNGTGPFSMENAQWIPHDKRVTSRVGTRNKIVAAAFLLHCALAQANGYQMGCVNKGPNAPQTMDMPPLPK